MLYPSVTSCLTITCLLEDAERTHLGGHASLQQKEGKLPSTKILPEMVALKPADKAVVAIRLAGALSAWNSSYLTSQVAIETDGTRNQPTGDADCKGAVAAAFGVSTDIVTTRDTPDGDVTVELTGPEIKTVDHATMVSGAWENVLTLDPVTDDGDDPAVGDVFSGDGKAWKVIAVPSARTYTLREYVS